MTSLAETFAGRGAGAVAPRGRGLRGAALWLHLDQLDTGPVPRAGDDTIELTCRRTAGHDATTRVHRPRVQPLLQLHEAHTGLGVPGEDRPLDRRRTTPPGQQREMHIDHGDLFQDVRLDQSPEGDDDPPLHAHTGLEYVVD